MTAEKDERDNSMIIFDIFMQAYSLTYYFEAYVTASNLQKTMMTWAELY